MSYGAVNSNSQEQKVKKNETREEKRLRKQKERETRQAL